MASRSTPLLTLAMPTFNRASSIGRALESLAAGLRGCPPGTVELDIRDNGSSDATPQIVAAFIESHQGISVRYDRNPENLGYDANHLLVWRHARGRHLLFCSDRYFYDLDFRHVVAALDAHAPAALVFSDRFRAVWPAPEAGEPTATHDDWLAGKLNATPSPVDGWPVLTTTAGSVIASGALKLNWIAANVSDLVVRRDTDPETEALLEGFLGSFMLVIAALLLPFRDEASRVSVLQVPWFSRPFEKMHSGGQRHDQLRVASGHLKLARTFPFVGSPEEIARFQVRVLLRNYLPIASGTGDYQYRYTPEEIRTFARESGATLEPRQAAVLGRLESMRSQPALRLLNAAFESVLLVGREARRWPRLARTLASVGRRGVGR